MLRLARPVLSALFEAVDNTLLSFLPSYGKSFGSNPLPGQVVVAVGVILAIRAYATFHNWKRIDPVPFKDDAAALRDWNTSSMKPLRGLQTAQFILSALLLFMAADSMETMATFRGLLLLLLLLTLVYSMTMGSSRDAHQDLVRSSTMNHFSWALQTLLLPGGWALCEDFLHSSWSGIILTALFYSLLFWSIWPLFILPDGRNSNESRAKGKDKACEESLQRLESVEQAAEQQSFEDSKRSAPGVEQLCAQTRKEMSAAMFVGLVDFVLLIVLQFG